MRVKALKPGYDSKAVQKELVDKVCAFFGRVYDDAEESKHLELRGYRRGDREWTHIMGSNMTINEVAAHFKITPMKVRKLLITGGYYDTRMYREIQQKIDDGMSIAEIATDMGKSPGTIRTYLPYERVIYNLEERSVNADRVQRFKERHGGYKAEEDGTEAE